MQRRNAVYTAANPPSFSKEEIGRAIEKLVVPVGAGGAVCGVGGCGEKAEKNSKERAEKYLVETGTEFFFYSVDNPGEKRVSKGRRKCRGRLYVRESKRRDSRMRKN